MFITSASLRISGLISHSVNKNNFLFPKRDGRTFSQCSLNEGCLGKISFKLKRRPISLWGLAMCEILRARNSNNLTKKVKKPYRLMIENEVRSFLATPRSRIYGVALAVCVCVIRHFRRRLLSWLEFNSAHRSSTAFWLCAQHYLSDTLWLCCVSRCVAA